MVEILQKHLKYKNKYKPNILYWGLGVENELYLEFDKLHPFNKTYFLNNHRRERYSVDYYTNYKKKILDKAFTLIAMNQDIYNDKLPLLMNSFSFTKTDCKNNSMTQYTKLTEPNNLFNGTLLTDMVFKNNNYLNTNYDDNFVYDGDTIEFITTNFFNTTLDSVIHELKYIKYNYILNLRKVFKEHNIFTEYGNINFMTKNNPFAIYLTNINNVNMFNNGTLHFNITLPTKLNKDGAIEDTEKFIAEHKQYIRFIQFMEPLLLAVYGTPDPFSYYLKISDCGQDENNSFSLQFSACSQRCAISRYIGIGTYDTNNMEKGKLLVTPINSTIVAKESYGWYNIYYKMCAYNKLTELGYDINFNKHLNHGIEIRFFDHIQLEDDIMNALKFLIYLGDFSLQSTNIINPIYNIIWNDLVVEVMKYGRMKILSEEHISIYNSIFNHTFLKKNIIDLYYEIYDLLKEKSKTFNSFSINILKNIIISEV